MTYGIDGIAEFDSPFNLPNVRHIETPEVGELVDIGLVHLLFVEDNHAPCRFAKFVFHVPLDVGH